MPVDPLKARQKVYQTVLATAAGKEMFDDLVLFAQMPNCSEARLLGRADMVLRMERERKRGEEAGENRVTARTSTRSEQQSEPEQE